MAFVSPQNETKHNQVQTCFRVAQFINEPQAYILKAKKNKNSATKKIGSAYCTKPVLCNNSLMHKTLPFHFLSFIIREIFKNENT